MRLAKGGGITGAHCGTGGSGNCVHRSILDIDVTAHRHDKCSGSMPIGEVRERREGLGR